VDRRRFLLTSLAGALAAPLAAVAQQASPVHRIGFLRVGPPPATWIEGFRQGLRELGHVEGQNIVIEFGLAEGAAQLPDVVAELVRLKVDVLVALERRQSCRPRGPRRQSRSCSWPPSTLLRPE
jgi:putative tryptophan/tyrosine transport system substrate-binding protein